MVNYDLEDSYGGYGMSTDARMSGSYMQSNWAQIAENTLPLKTSKLAAANYGQFQASIEQRSRKISTKVIIVNLVSLLINLLLAIIAFYFSFTNNSPSTTAFAVDCVLDFMSSAILLWRYHGDLNNVYMHAREQIACIYLGVLFEISGLGIIIKAVSDMTSDYDAIVAEATGESYELVYLAIAATIACCVLTWFKCSLYKLLRDNSILLDVINTVISTVFAMSILMSQILINVNPSFWYLDPILGLVLASFMIGFGVKVIHQNFNILQPIYCNGQTSSQGQHLILA